MATRVLPTPLELIPAEPQTLWGPLAVANFSLGGLGAGLYVIAGIASGFGLTPALILASWASPALVLAGFAAVALEAGRPLRGVRVLTRLRTSWMSRELWLGGLFAVLAPGSLGVPHAAARLAAALAAVGLVLAQGFILRRARGVPAWAVPPMPFVFVSSALVSGAGLVILLDLAQGRLSSTLLGLALAVLTVHVVLWSMSVDWSSDASFTRSVRPLREGRGTLVILGGGYLAPSLGLALAVALPVLAPPLAALAAALMILSQVYAKAVLVLHAGQLRPITLARLRLDRRVR